MELRGQSSLVTGSAKGIGRAIALALARAGADVGVHCRRSLEQAAGVAEQIRSLGVQTAVFPADLADAGACPALVEQVWQHFGRVDIWVNNAGGDVLTGPDARLPFEAKLERLLAVDLRGTIALARDVGRRMKSRGSGVILNMGWDQAETGFEGDSGQLFCAVKAAVMAFTKSLALDLAPEVRVNCLAPGWIRTQWGEHAPARWQQRAVDDAPLRRWGTPEDVAAAARFLCSPEAAFITGQVICVNGGAVR